jgi:hypothetical protein
MQKHLKSLQWVVSVVVDWIVLAQNMKKNMASCCDHCDDDISEDSEYLIECLIFSLQGIVSVE